MQKRVIGVIFALSCVFSAASFVACSESPAETVTAPPPPAEPVDASIIEDAADAAPPISFPSVQALGGPVMKSPRVVPIFFAGGADGGTPAGDVPQAQIEAFLAELATADYWAAATREYGVGPLTVAPSVVSSDPPPSTLATLHSWLTQMTDGTHEGWPVADESTVFGLIYPPDSSLTAPSLGKSCEAFGGFHYEVLAAKKIVYFVSHICPSSYTGGQSAIDERTTTIAHELVEAATNPLSESAMAYYGVDADHAAFALATYGELGDMCFYEGRVDLPLGSGMKVPRVWSNVEARAGRDPCVPHIGEPYFVGAPIFNEPVPIDFSTTTKGLRLAVGESKTVDVFLYSEAEGSWLVQAAAWTDVGTLKFAFDRPRAKTGETIHLTITRLKASPDQGSVITLVSSRDASHGGEALKHRWYGFVAN